MPGAPYRPSAPLSKKEHLPVRESKKFLAELVLHNYPKETALKYAHTHWRLFLRQAEKPCWG